VWIGNSNPDIGRERTPTEADPGATVRSRSDPCDRTGSRRRPAWPFLRFKWQTDRSTIRARSALSWILMILLRAGWINKKNLSWLATAINPNDWQYSEPCDTQIISS
jgi:hypothetical protein